MPTEIHLFDFDGTLFRSPLPPPGWGKKDWWSYPGSLEPPCVPDTPGSDWWVQSTAAQARRSIADRSVWAVLATGRQDHLFRWRVPELLKLGGFDFDEVHLSDGDTLPFKKSLLLRLLRRFPHVQRVRLWDDRDAHTAEFDAMLKRIGIEFEITVVRANPMPAACGIDPATARVAAMWMDAKAPTPVRQVIFIGAFLTPMSRQRLLRDFPPVHEEVHADHMTVWYEPPEEAVEGLHLGRQVRLKVVGVAEDEHGQAVVVRPEGVRAVNRFPHVTVSTAPGTSPSYSNDLIGHGWRPVVGPTLTAVLDTHPR